MLYTDGIIEEHNPSGEMYGEKRLKEIFNLLAASNNDNILNEIYDNIKTFSENSNFDDDVTMLLLEFS